MRLIDLRLDHGCMTELHNHLTIGLRPEGTCPACDLLREDFARIRSALAV